MRHRRARARIDAPRARRYVATDRSIYSISLDFPAEQPWRETHRPAPIRSPRSARRSKRARARSSPWRETLGRADRARGRVGRGCLPRRRQDAAVRQRRLGGGRPAHRGRVGGRSGRIARRCRRSRSRRTPRTSPRSATTTASSACSRAASRRTAAPATSRSRISTSGNSPNVIAAVEEARRRAAPHDRTARQGRRQARRRWSSCALVVPSSDTQRIQECHIAIGHAIAELVDRRCSPSSAARETTPAAHRPHARADGLGARATQQRAHARRGAPAPAGRFAARASSTGCRGSWPPPICAPRSTPPRAPARRGKLLLWGFGAHLIKVGLAPVMVDLMERGLVSAAC